MTTINDAKDLRKQERFLRLFEPLYDRLFRYAYALTKSRTEAKDLVGETTLRAYESFDKLKDSQAFLSYLFTIARRVYKRQQWRNRIFRNVETSYFSDVASAESELGDAADIEKLFLEIDRLPAKPREALILYHISGLSLREIQVIQGGTLSGVKVRLKRARATLAKRLGADNDLERQFGSKNNREAIAKDTSASSKLVVFEPHPVPVNER